MSITAPHMKRFIVASVAFGYAIDALKEGKKAFRANWNGKNMWLGLQRPDEHSANTQPYIYLETAQGDRVPWVASQTDILARDWSIFE